MAPKELKIYILHGLCVVSVVSVVSGSKTASDSQKSTDLDIEENMTERREIFILIEIEQHGA